MAKDQWSRETAVTVLAPGLSVPRGWPPERVPATPVIDRFLRRGSRCDPVAAGRDLTGGRLATRLLQLFGAAASGPYARAADDPSWDRQGCVAQADPVHLRPDRDQLRLFDARHLGLAQEEADALVAELNEHLAGEGMRLVAPMASRWYLELPEPSLLEALPLDRVVGRSVEHLSPQGPDARRWAAIMTEVQMLLFGSAVNQARQARARPAVNGIWISGVGVWRPLENPQGWTRLCSDQALARGLAEAAGLQLRRADAEMAQPGTLAVADEMAEVMLDADPERWADAASTLDARLAGPLAALRSGELGLVELDLCDGRRWCVRRASLRRFWRRGSGLSRLEAL